MQEIYENKLGNLKNILKRNLAVNLTRWESAENYYKGEKGEESIEINTMN